MLRVIAVAVTLGCLAVLLWIWLVPVAGRGDLVSRVGDCRRGAAAASWQHLDQGWKALDEWQFWYTSQGSQMVPYDWFMSLEQPGHREGFATSDYLAKFGFIPAPRGRCNPDGLPLGFTLDAATQQLGLSCAACHTRLIRTAGREILVNGAPAEIHFNRFLRELAEALEQTVADNGSWSRFIRRLHPKGVPAEQRDLRGEVKAAAQRLRLFQRFVAAGADDDGEFAGFGRVDAFGAIFNRVAVTALGRPANYRSADAPVNYPFLWGAPQLDVTQWNGSAPNHVAFGPLARNLGEAIGLFGGVTLTLDREIGFRSPVKIDNLHMLEALVEKLQPPSWNAAGLPPIDTGLAAQGYRIYNRECRHCHSLPADKYPIAPPHPLYSHVCKHCHADARVVGAEQVGTDPVAANNFLERDAETGALEGQRKWLLAGDRYGKRAATRELVITAIVGVILNNRLGSVRAEDLLGLTGERPKDTAGYKARPLAGIWATAPYLHNGSVPTLADLLEPPAQRPVDFRVGPRTDLDTSRVGIGSDPSGFPTSYFDTRLRGNSNAGHPFGTELDAADKRALLEFLKTL